MIGSASNREKEAMKLYMKKMQQTKPPMARRNFHPIVTDLCRSPAAIQATPKLNVEYPLIYAFVLMLIAMWIVSITVKM